VDDTLTSPPRGASVWEHELFTYLTEHTRREGAMLQEYATIAEQTESKALAYVINLLLEDERRHHRFFNELAASLKSEAELSGVEPVIPRLDLRRVARAELLEITDRMLESEKSDALELKRLRKDLKDVEDSTLWGLLVDIMSRDTEKHVAILRFLADHAKPTRAAI
jgi:rubrerythrin